LANKFSEEEWAWSKISRSIPDEIEHWSLTTLREKLVKIGAKVVRGGRYRAMSVAARMFSPH
jgi:hypothetical protein